MGNDGRPWHGGRVLVCDDNLLMADVVAEFLRECGLKPMGPVGHLESAMQMARERALDGAILDINMAGRPCFPICAILSARRIPFVFLTGYPEAGIPVEYRGTGLITKPFEPTEMKEVLAHMLGLPEGLQLPEQRPSSRLHRRSQRAAVAARSAERDRIPAEDTKHRRSVARPA